MQKYIRKLLLLVVCGTVVACGNLQFPGVYRLTIEQGNIVTQEMVDQLKPGMSKEQVEYIMGSPTVKDTFNNQRWDYVYTLEKGDKSRKQNRISIFFEADSLKYFSGDFIPTAATGQTDS